MVEHKQILFLLLFLNVIICLNSVIAASPSGATISPGPSTTTPSGDAGNISAVAGNITYVSIFSASSVTQSWQGYYGNVSGGLRLADASSNIFYNWSLSTPSGEVYASVNSSISWSNIQCFNFTAMGNYSDESGNGGTTSNFGTNISQIEDAYNISSTDLDSVNSTFYSFNHDPFYTASREFSADECRSVQLFNNNSLSEDGKFEEVLLYEPVTASVVFTSILEEASLGFDNNLVDFEMLVLDDGHGANTDATLYYFFVELE